ncbi:MAG TPA: phosphotransferase [Acidimicrobiales bacterium]
MSSADRVIAAGRDTEIVDHGPGRVLRRPRVPRSMEAEGHIMAWVTDHGYPCPEVFEVGEEGLVMARVDGVSMLDDLVAHPWRVRSHATLLADLHGWLHRLPVPSGLAEPFGPGAALLHGDLHPGNVMLAADGPMVIDWTNAVRGPAGADVAVTWLLMAAGQVETSAVERLAVLALRRILVRSFLRTAGPAEATRALDAVFAHRRGDANLSPDELEAMRRIVAHHRPG